MSTDSPSAAVAPLDLKTEVAKLFADVLAAATATAAGGTPGTLAWLKVLVDLFEGAEDLVANHGSTDAEFKALVAEFEDQFKSQIVDRLFHGGGLLQRVENFAAGTLLPKLVEPILTDHRNANVKAAASPAGGAGPAPSTETTTAAPTASPSP